VTVRRDFAAGARAAAGPAAATLVLGVSFGAAAANAGWGTGAPLLFSALGFSGSAQFSLLTTLPTGSALAGVTSATLINARYLVMGIALNDSLRGNRAWRAVQAQALVDASFVVAAPPCRSGAPGWPAPASVCCSSQTPRCSPSSVPM
jgi:predicted branched-subunit amino acid permease